MTLDEYYAMRAAEEQDQYYLQGSRNRKESYKLTYREPYTADSEKLDRDWVNNLVNTLSRDTGLTKGEIYDRIENGTLTGNEQIQADKYSINTVRHITDTVDRIVNKRNPTLVVTPSKPIANNALLHYARTDLQNAIMDRLLSNFKGYATLRRTLASKKNIDLNRPLFT